MAKKQHVSRSKRSRERARGARREARELLEMPVETRQGRRRRARQRQGQVARAIGSMVVLVALVTALYVAYLRAFANNPEFTLRSIEVSGLGRMSRQEVLAAANIPVMANLIKLDLESIRNRILGLSQIDSVQVRRRLPDTLEIDVEERQPLLWLAGGPPPLSAEAGLNPARRVGGILLDAEGHAIRCRALHREYLTLPVIHLDRRVLDQVIFGRKISSDALAGAMRLMALWREYQADPSRVLRAIDARRPFRLEVVCGTGLRVLFTTDAFEPQLLKLEDVLHHGESRGRSFESINLTVKANVPVVYRTEELLPAAGEDGISIEQLSPANDAGDASGSLSSDELRAITTVES